MFVSRKKLKALVDENMALQEQNHKLRRELDVRKDENVRLSDDNFDLWYDNKLLKAKLMKKEGRKFGEYFYGTSKKLD